MELPKLSDYLSADPVERRTMQAQLTGAAFERVREARSFREVRLGIEGVVQAMGQSGYDVRLLDDDAESMISYGGQLGESSALTLQAYWDDGEGASLSFVFRDGDRQLVWAATERGGVIEVDSI